MAEKGKFETAEKRIRTAYSKFGAFNLALGLFALVAAVAGLVIMLRTEKAEVTAQVLANDELTMYPAVAELKGHFTYADEEVTHLWKVRVKFLNSGDKTVVGMGNQKNILSEGLNFVFPDDTTILRIEEESETFQSNMGQIEQNHFQIQFSQWRSGEYNITSFYIASEKSLEALPCPSVPSRDIIDGNVIIQDLTEREPTGKMTMIDRLPEPIKMMGKIMGGIIAGSTVIIMLIIVSLEWKPAIRLKRWKTRYLASFSDYVDHIEPPLSDRDKKRFKRRPYKLPDGFWANFDGEQVPVKNPMFDSIFQAVGVTFSFFLLAFGYVCLILMLIPA